MAAADSDEDKYANESFENDSDEIPEISGTESESDNEQLPKNNSLYVFARNRFNGHAKVTSYQNKNCPQYDSSSDDDNDVVISETIAEINTEPMRMEEALLTPKINTVRRISSRKQDTGKASAMSTGRRAKAVTTAEEMPKIVPNVEECADSELSDGSVHSALEYVEEPEEHDANHVHRSKPDPKQPDEILANENDILLTSNMLQLDGPSTEHLMDSILNIDYHNNLDSPSSEKFGTETVNYRDTEANYPNTDKYRNADANYRNADDNYRDTDDNYRNTDTNYRDTDNNYQNTDGNYRDTDNNYQNTDGNYRNTDANCRDIDNNYRHANANYGDNDDNAKKITTIAKLDDVCYADYEPQVDAQITSQTPTSFNTDDYAFHLNFVNGTPSNEKFKLRPVSRKSWSFSNSRMREIERENQILLRKILTQKPTYVVTTPRKPKNPSKFAALPPTTRTTSAAINRKKQQRQIDLDNQGLKRRIEAISLRRPHIQNLN